MPEVLEQFDADKFWREGYAVFRSVFTPEQVGQWRSAGLARGDSAADLLSDSQLSEIVLHPAVLAIARAILGGDPVYFGDSTVLIGDHGSGFHKDNADRDDPAAPDWAVSKYPLIRFGLYTQEHNDRLPGGLDLRVGSHEHCDLTSGPHVSPAVQPGDLVVWNMRITHSGNSRILKYLNHRLTPSSLFSRVVEKFAGSHLLRSLDDERLGFFFSFGLAGPQLDRYLRYLKSRSYAVDNWHQSHWPSEIRSRIEQTGLSVVDMTGYVPTPEDGPVNVQHRTIPY